MALLDDQMAGLKGNLEDLVMMLKGIDARVGVVQRNTKQMENLMGDYLGGQEEEQKETAE